MAYILIGVIGGLWFYGYTVWLEYPIYKKIHKNDEKSQHPIRDALRDALKEYLYVWLLMTMAFCLIAIVFGAIAYAFNEPEYKVLPTEIYTLHEIQNGSYIQTLNDCNTVTVYQENKDGTYGPVTYGTNRVQFVDGEKATIACTYKCELGDESAHFWYLFPSKEDGPLEIESVLITLPTEK